MKQKRLSRKNAIYTTRTSEATVMVNYAIGQRILEVEFTGGRVYHYLKVPPRLWEEYIDDMQSGGSSGNFINKQIKPFYKYIEIKDA
jgi:hypothetical protein